MNNNTFKHYLIGSILVPLGVTGLSAHTNPAPAATEMKSSSGESFHPFGITAEVGTTGAGGSINWRFLGHLGLRAGMDYFDYPYSGSVESADYEAKFRLMSEPVALDLYPSKTRSFHLSLGVLINQTRFSGTAKPSGGSIDINGNHYTPDELGTLHLKVNQPAVCPYVSIGGNFFDFDHVHHWSMGGELGAAYGKWSVDLHHTGGSGTSELNADIAAERDKIHDTFNRIPVWPIIKLNLSYSF